MLCIQYIGGKYTYISFSAQLLTINQEATKISDSLNKIRLSSARTMDKHIKYAQTIYFSAADMSI